ncbi:MAG: hypothetical protein QOG74_2474, partial [Alphaproteobacteria bacterium]|nr:hypothetical protein [Alphaproteobacteria bacterium]
MPSFWKVLVSATAVIAALAGPGHAQKLNVGLTNAS